MSGVVARSPLSCGIHDDLAKSGVTVAKVDADLEFRDFWAAVTFHTASPQSIM